MPYAEAKMWNELYMSMEAQMVYGVRQTKPSQDGYWIKTGAGIREQLKDGNTDYISTAPSVVRLKDYLMDIFFAREDIMNRKVVGTTGSLGSVNFHDALAAVASSFLTMDTHYIGRDSSEQHSNALFYGAQFTKYKGPLGIEISMMLNPMYDSRQYCKISHPQYTEYPIDSARLTFLDFGSSGGEQNIMALKVKDTFRHFMVHGSVTPNGPVKGGQAVSMLKAAYDVACEGTAGIMIKDVTRCGSTIEIYIYENSEELSKE